MTSPHLYLPNCGAANWCVGKENAAIAIIVTAVASFLIGEGFQWEGGGLMMSDWSAGKAGREEKWIET